MMIERRTAHVTYFLFHSLAQYPDLVHGVTGRLADPVQFPLGLNLSFAVADDPSRVVAARRAVCTGLGIPPANLVVPRQIHGVRVAAVQAVDRGLGALDRASAIPDCDALITRDDDVALFVSAADCVPLLFYDPIRRAIGVAHAGWRGTLARIASATAAALSTHCDVAPADLRVAIGPSIGPCCYSVGREVVDAATEAFGAASSSIIISRHGRLYLDLWQANKLALAAAGVKPENVELAGICTSCHRDIFFSHRAEQGSTGRFGAIIMLRGTRGL